MANHVTPIAKGVALLDEKMPGWHARVDIRRLDMGSGLFYRAKAGDCGCVLAQVDAAAVPFGSYTSTAMDLGVYRLNDAVAHGFNTPYGPHLDDEAAYEELTRTWRRVIARRQGYRG